MKKGAFTLIEIMVVLAVIATVAAILFPIISSAKEKSKETVSISNMRQLWVAVELYRQDYDHIAYGTMEAMGLPETIGEKHLGSSVRDLRPPNAPRNWHYYYYPVPAWIDHRNPTWEAYTQEHQGKTVLLADIWFNPVRINNPYQHYWMDPELSKYVVGVTLDGNMRKKRSAGHLFMAWWDR